MSVQLTDLPAAVTSYLRDVVQVQISRVTGQLSAGDEGHFTVRVTNGSFRLRDVTLHLRSTRPDVAQIVPDSGLVISFRAGGSRSEPLLPDGVEVPELYAFFLDTDRDDLEPNDTLSPGEVLEQEFVWKAKGAGEGQFTAHVHAEVDFDDLFPRDNGVDGSHKVVVRG